MSDSLATTTMQRASNTENGKQFLYNVVISCRFNSLWLSDAIWRHQSGSTLLLVQRLFQLLICIISFKHLPGVDVLGRAGRYTHVSIIYMVIYAHTMCYAECITILPDIPYEYIVVVIPGSSCMCTEIITVYPVPNYPWVLPLGTILQKDDGHPRQCIVWNVRHASAKWSALGDSLGKER